MIDEKAIEAAAKVSTLPEFSAVESPLILAICQAYESELLPRLRGVREAFAGIRAALPDKWFDVQTKKKSAPPSLVADVDKALATLNEIINEMEK